MTDTAPADAPPADPEVEALGLVAEVEHDPVEHGEVLDSIDLVRTGIIRLVINGRKVTLRRPFFGELKRLRLALENLTDSITDARIDAEATGAEIRDEMKALADDEALGHRERAEASSALRRRDREAGRALTGAADDARLEWWVEVFAVLGVEAPADWPSWVGDATLPNRVIQHWRSAPLARG